MQKSAAIRENVVENSLDKALIQLRNVDLSSADHLDDTPVQEGKAMVYELFVSVFDGHQFLIEFLLVSDLVDVEGGLVDLVLSDETLLG